MTEKTLQFLTNSKILNQNSLTPKPPADKKSISSDQEIFLSQRRQYISAPRTVIRQPATPRVDSPINPYKYSFDIPKDIDNVSDINTPKNDNSTLSQTSSQQTTDDEPIFTNPYLSFLSQELNEGECIEIPLHSSKDIDNNYKNTSTLPVQQRPTNNKSTVHFPPILDAIPKNDDSQSLFLKKQIPQKQVLTAIQPVNDPQTSSIYPCNASTLPPVPYSGKKPIPRFNIMAGITISPRNTNHAGITLIHPPTPPAKPSKSSLQF